MNANSEIVQRVKNATVEMLTNRNAPPVNLYVENNVLPAGQVINAQHQQIPVDENTIMVFSDEAPQFNWGHTCRYFLYTANNGTMYKEVEAQFPPYLINPPETFELFREMVPKAVEPLTWPKLPGRRVIKIPWGNRYAVLFSGASNNRHVNDLEFLYRDLVDHYGFKTENIYVLNFDGTVNYSVAPTTPLTWPDGTPYRMVVNGKGTRTDLDAVFDTLKTRLKYADLLLIHTNNHGGRSTESYLCTYSGGGYLATDFAIKLSTLPRFTHLMVMMEQCFSGGFVSPIMARTPALNTTVATACNATSSSIGGAYFDPFAKDWISAIAGHKPDGAALASDPDTDHNGRISAHEAFNYAYAVKDPYDTPIYQESSAVAGACDLLQRFLTLQLPWFSKAVADAIQKYQDKLPIDVFYAKIYGELGPRLSELQAEIELRDNQLNDEMTPRITDLVNTVMEAEEVQTEETRDTVVAFRRAA